MSNGYGDGQALGVRWAPAPAREDPSYGPDPACQPCPDCGGLECLCRPRFFAGQLLTEQDLNRLDRYITEKHAAQPPPVRLGRGLRAGGRSATPATSGSSA